MPFGDRKWQGPGSHRQSTFHISHQCFISWVKFWSEKVPIHTKGDAEPFDYRTIGNFRLTLFGYWSQVETHPKINGTVLVVCCLPSRELTYPCTPHQWERKLIFPTAFWMGYVSCQKGTLLVNLNQLIEIWLAEVAWGQHPCISQHSNTGPAPQETLSKMILWVCEDECSGSVTCLVLWAF